MRFSNDLANWSAWEAAAGTKAWALTEGNGVKTVYMELKDAAGNVTVPPIGDSIELKTSSPEVPGVPALPSVSIASSNAVPTLARTGDTATLTFVSSKPLGGVPTVTIAGRAAKVASIGNNVYKALLHGKLHQRSQMWILYRPDREKAADSRQHRVKLTEVIFDERQRAGN